MSTRTLPCGLPPLLRSSDQQLLPTRLLWLTQQEADAHLGKLYRKQARSLNNVPSTEFEGRTQLPFRSRQPLLTPSEVKSLLDSLVGARIEATKMAVEVRETGPYLEMAYWGVPVVRKELASGRLFIQDHLAYSLVAPGRLDSLRRDIALTLTAQHLAQHKGVPIESVVCSFAEYRGPMKPTAVDKQGALLFMQALARLTPGKHLKAHSASATRALEKHFFDPPVAQLIRQASQPNFLLEDYNAVLAHQALYERVRTQTPSLMPVLHRYVCRLPLALKEASSPEDKHKVALQFDQLRAVLLRNRFTSKQFWKFLLTLSRGAIKDMLEPGPVTLAEANGWPAGAHEQDALHTAASALIHVQKAWLLGLSAKQLKSKAVRQTWMDILARLHVDILAPMTPEQRILLRDTLESLVAAKNYRAAYQLGDWLAGAGAAAGYPRAGMRPAQVMEACEQWHLARTSKNTWEARTLNLLRQAGLEVSLQTTWPEGASAFEQDGISVRPLNSAQLLWDEHVSMRHCVQSYVGDCLQGDCHLFHLQDTTDKKVRSTLEIRKVQGAWKIRQHEGPGNTPPADALLSIEKVVLQRVMKRLKGQDTLPEATAAKDR